MKPARKHLIWTIGLPLAGALLLLAGCGQPAVTPTTSPVAPTIPPTPTIPSGATLLENTGTVCFYPLAANSVRVSISAGCFSSSCTEVFERNGNISVAAEGFVIQLHSRFVARSTALTPLPSGDLRLCTADCGGAGFLEFVTGALKPGTYTVWLGQVVLGTVDVPLPKSSVCLDPASPTPTPLPPPSPTAGATPRPR